MENEANWSLRAVTIRGGGEGSCRGDEADSGSGAETRIGGMIYEKDSIATERQKAKGKS